MRRRTLLLAVATLAVVGAVLFTQRAIRSDEAPSNSRAGESAASTSPRSDALSSKVEPEVARVRPETGREIVPPAEESVAGSKATDFAKDSAILLVRTVVKESGRPMPGVRVYVSKKDEDVDWTEARTSSSKGDLAHPPLTDDEGRAELSIPSGADLMLRIDEHGKCESLELAVPPLLPAERRSLTIELLTGDDLHLFGRVVDAESGAPIAGARISTIVTTPIFSVEEGRRDKRDLLGTATTDAAGGFEIRFPSWKHPHIRVEADGFGLAVLRLYEGHDAPDRALVVRMSRAGKLDAQVLDPAGSPMPDITIRLVADAYALPPVDPTSLGGDVSVPDERWTGTTAADGRCTLDGLSPDVELRIDLLRGERVLRHEPDPVELRPGEVLRREWVLGAGCALSGLALDQDEKAVPALDLWLVQAVPYVPQYFNTWDEATAVAKTSTDADGRFMLRDVAAGSWLLVPAPRRRANPQATTNDSVASIATPVEVSSARTQDVTIHVSRSLFIRGQVVDPEGHGVGDSDVMAMPSADSWGPQGQSADDGSFAVGPVGAGKFVLVAMALDRFASSEPVEAEAGASGVKIRLRVGGALRGRIVDSRTGRACAAEVNLTPHVRQPGLFGAGVGWGVREDGAFERKGLEAGNYDLVARTEDGGFGVLSGIGVVTGEMGKEFVLAISPGGVVALRYEGTHPLAAVEFLLDGIRLDQGSRVPRGKPLERAAPAGTFTIEVRVDAVTPVQRLTVHLDPGEVKEIRLGDGE